MNGLKIALTGSNGFLAESIKARCKDQHHLNFLSLNSLNTGNYDEDIIEKHLSAEMPDYLIHTSSITDVDYCEKNKVEAYHKNINKTVLLVEICNRLKIRFIFISSDYVFDNQTSPITECFTKRPLNFYGLTKSIGEDLVTEISDSFLVIRCGIIIGYLKDNRKSITEKVFLKSPLGLDNSRIKYPVLNTELTDNLLFTLLNWNAFKNKTLHFSNTHSCTKLQLIKLVKSELGLKSDNLFEEAETSFSPRPNQVNMAPSQGLAIKFSSISTIAKKIARDIKKNECRKIEEY